MKAIKRIAALALCLALVCTMLPGVSLTAHAETYSGSCGDNLTWSFAPDTGVLTIEGSGAMENYDGWAPWSVYCESITQVSLPDGLTSIGKNAFSGCTGLTSVVLPDGLETICFRAFEYCTGLTDVSFPAGLEVIEAESFFHCTALTEVTIPASVRSIQGAALGYCSDGQGGHSKVEGFTIYGGEGTAAQFYAESHGFAFVPAMVVYPTSGSCGENLTWSFDPDTGLLTISGSGEMTSYDVYHNYYAPWYAYRQQITRIELPNGLTGISDGAFWRCPSMRSVRIPTSVTYIGEYAFGFDYDEESNLPVQVEGFTIYGYKGTEAQLYADRYEFAFVVLTEGLPTSGVCGAEGDNLTWSLNTDTGVLTIEGNGAMASYEGYGNIAPWGGLSGIITAVELPSGLTNIGSFAFCDCTSLTAVSIPEGVTLIELYAFSKCTALADVSFPESLDGIGMNAFYGCNDLCAVRFPANMSSIEMGAFCGTGLTSVTLPDKLTVVDSWVFSGCEALTSVVFPEGLVEIVWNAFSGCTALTEITFPESLETIGTEAFAGCTGLTVLSFPARLKYIEYGAFRGCTGLTEVNLPRNLGGIGASAFAGCPNLRSVRIPASVSYLQYHAFGYVMVDAETGEEGKVEGFTVYGAEGSAAQDYAEENGFNFVSTLQNPFVDVNKGDYFFNPVLWALENKITAGVDENLFGAGNPCTREQIVTFLWKAAGSPQPTTAECDFTDVQPGTYYYNAVLWAREKGITSGMGDGTFGVGLPCTRAQAMTFLWVSQGRPSPTGGTQFFHPQEFTDVEDGAWYYNPVRWAVENRVTAGMGDGTFGVGVTCTRAQIITFLFKAFTMPNA